ncbi:hypothetical protein [Dokdonella sp.]|uniref:hypothetical protein n=1 Tax=Dokdonella sp. TaxID=2291710 RepID=UPI003783A3CB
MSKSDVEPPIERIRGELRAAAERARHQAPEFPRRVPKQVELQPEIAPIVQTDAHAGATVQSTVANVTGVVQLGQLSQFHGAAFVRNAYLALLGREADETAVKTQMALLGRGISKIEIMGNLRWSAEGRFKAVSVPGLWPRYLLQKATHVPILGYVLQLAMGLAGLPAIVRHQRAADALHVTRADAIEQATHALDARLQSQAEEGARLRVDHDALQVRAAAAESALAQLSEAIQATSGLAHQSNQQMLGMNHWLASLRHSLAEIERLAECKGRERAVPLAGITDGLLAADASRSARLDQWLEQFAGGLPAAADVLDLGGAADWLDRLSQRGVSVSALRSIGNPGPVAGDRRIAVCNDFGVALSRIADESLHGLSVLEVSVVARELPLMDLLQGAFRVLRPNACILIGLDRGPLVLAELLSGRQALAMDADLLEAALAHGGFHDIKRFEANGVACVIARRSSQRGRA